MAIVYLGIGTNLGNKPQNLNDAIQQISLQVGDVWLKSAFYPTKAWGYQSENEFLNGVIAVNSTLSPQDILSTIKQIELDLGRETGKRTTYEDRLIDVDILFYDSQIVQTPHLQIPHPLLHQRDFVLLPLAEIAPHLLHPVLNESILNLKVKLLSPESGSEVFSSRVHKFDFPTKRFCQTLDLKNDPELIAMYKKQHSEPEMWQEILSGIREVGILEMEIYLLENRLFMILEVPAHFNWDEAFARLAALPRQAEWEDYMTRFQEAEPGTGSADKWKLMEQIFYLYKKP